MARRPSTGPTRSPACSTSFSRKDFDGLEIEAFPRRPHYDGGDPERPERDLGRNFDRGFIGLGSEYFSSDPVTYADAPGPPDVRATSKSTRAGSAATRIFDLPINLGMHTDGCGTIFPLAGRVAVPLAGSIYYTPGRSNGGWGDFSETTSRYGGFPIDGDGDGETERELSGL